MGNYRLPPRNDMLNDEGSSNSSLGVDAGRGGFTPSPPIMGGPLGNAGVLGAGAVGGPTGDEGILGKDVAARGGCAGSLGKVNAMSPFSSTAALASGPLSAIAPTPDGQVIDRSLDRNPTSKLASGFRGSPLPPVPPVPPPTPFRPGLRRPPVMGGGYGRMA